MMISGVSRAFSLSIYRLDLVAPPSAGPTSPATVSASPVDRVTLSPEATTASAAAASDSTAEAAPAEAPPSPAASTPSRADALFAALDADEDGAISDDEFSDGARRLLRRGHRHGHGHGHDGERERVDGPGHGHYGRHGRLERRLERLFDRVDGNGDGAIDRDELTAALAPRERPAGDGADATAGAETAGAGVAVRITVVAVSVAVQRYTSVQDPTAAAGTAPTASPVDRPSGDVHDEQHLTSASPDPRDRAQAA